MARRAAASIRRFAPVSERRGGPPAAGAFQPVISSYLSRAYPWVLFRIRNKRHRTEPRSAAGSGARRRLGVIFLLGSS